MRDMNPEIAELRQRLIRTFNDEVSTWGRRKDNAPEPEGYDDYWWECKAKRSMCMDALSIIEEVDTIGTSAQYRSRVESALRHGGLGSMGNWGDTSHASGLSHVHRLARRELNRTPPDVTDAGA